MTSNGCIGFSHQVHILESSRAGRVGAAAVLEFWVQVLTEQNVWYRDKTVLYLLDHLSRAAFLHQHEECLQKILYQQHKVAQPDFHLLFYPQPKYSMPDSPNQA